MLNGWTPECFGKTEGKFGDVETLLRKAWRKRSGNVTGALRDDAIRKTGQSQSQYFEEGQLINSNSELKYVHIPRTVAIL